VAAGDAAAFDRLVEDHRARVTGLAFRLLGWTDEVEDVVQDVFLTVLKNTRKFRGESGLSTWLTAITVNTCRKRGRKQQLRQRLLAHLGGRRRSALAPAADASAADRETFTGVRDAVRALPSRDREVIVLRYLEQMSVDRIGEVLGVSKNAVEVRLSRARQRLRELLPASCAE
jgi:RNA polymerase sigma-70 factor (ECF subfamily)